MTLRPGTAVRVHAAMGDHTIEGHVVRADRTMPDWYIVHGADEAGSFKGCVHRDNLTITDNRPDREIEMTTTTKKPTRKPTATKAKASRTKRTPKGEQPARGPSKADLMMSMVKRPEGASVAELVEAFGVLPHSARAVVSVESRKRGLTVKTVEGRLRVI